MALSFQTAIKDQEAKKAAEEALNKQSALIILYDIYVDTYEDKNRETAHIIVKDRFDETVKLDWKFNSKYLNKKKFESLRRSYPKKLSNITLTNRAKHRIYDNERKIQSTDK